MMKMLNSLCLKQDFISTEGLHGSGNSDDRACGGDVQ